MYYIYIYIYRACALIYMHYIYDATIVNEIKFLPVHLIAETRPVVTPGLRNETLLKVMYPRPLPPPSAVRAGV